MILAVALVADDGLAQGTSGPRAEELALLDPDAKVAIRYQVTAIPTHYFIDKTGVIRSREVGPKDWRKPETWRVIEGLLQ